MVKRVCRNCKSKVTIKSVISPEEEGYCEGAVSGTSDQHGSFHSSSSRSAKVNTDKEIEDLRKKVAQRDIEHEELWEQMNTDRYEAVKELDKMKIDMRSREQQVKTAISERDEARRLQNQSEQDVQAMNRKKCEDSVNLYSSENRDVRTKRKTDTEPEQHLNNIIEEQKIRIQRKENEYVELKKENDKTKEERNRLQKDNERLQKDVSGSEAEKDVLKAELNIIHKQHDEIHVQRKEQDAIQKSAPDKSMLMAGQVNQLNAERTNLLSKIDILQKRIDRVEEDCGKYIAYYLYCLHNILSLYFGLCGNLIFL